MRIAGIDLGERRIGLAVSDATATLARPVSTLERGASDAAAVELVSTAITALAADDPIGCVVVGLPTRLNSTDNLQTQRVKTMVALLAARLKVPVVTQDERLSSYEADQRLRLHQKDWRKRKARLDAAAAAVILQDYLDEQAAVRGERRGARGEGQGARGKGRGDE